MYGMVNQAIKDLVVTKFGNESWKKICDSSKISPDDFIFMLYYPDGITYQLVGAASVELKLAPEVILREFGKYWVLYTAKEGYGAMMDLFGSNFKACLQNLNNLHARMGMTMPQLSPPRFTFKEIDEKKYIVSYFSKRAGQCPMVIGLLEGLAAKYNERATIELLADSNESGEKQFQITLE
jgi:hypothetical protein